MYGCDSVIGVVLKGILSTCASHFSCKMCHRTNHVDFFVVDAFIQNIQKYLK
jgi:hypothetical protein